MVTLLITKGASELVLSFRAVAGEIRESVGGVLDVRLRECASSRPWSVLDSYLVDPASNICLFQRLSHACLRISELIQ